MKKRTIPTLAALAALTLPGLVAAQDVAAPRGRIGISYNVTVVGDNNRVTSDIVVTDVEAGSPAALAGLRVGDHLVSVNHVAGVDSLSRLRDYLHLMPGDAVRIVVMRDGERLGLSLRATAEQPARSIQGSYSFSWQPDADMVEEASRAIDSLRIRLIERGGAVAVLHGDEGIRIVGTQEGAPRTDATRGVVVSGGADAVVETHELRAPFAFRVFAGQGHDTLILQMSELNRSMRLLRAREAERMRELMRAGDAPLARVSDDDVIRSVRGSLEELRSRSRTLNHAMEEAMREGFEESWVVTAPEPGRMLGDATPPREGGLFSPMTPYLLGENRAAGAEVKDMPPELASYFDVEWGVLVVEVPPGTPAAVAGILPGDVITRIDQVNVRSVEDLRLGLSRVESEIPVTLVRKGESRQVLLRRSR